MSAGTPGFHQRGAGSRLARLLFLVFFIARPALGVGDYCWVCKKEIFVTIYTWEDKVTHTQRRLCSNCVNLRDACYLCSLPVLKDFTALADGRAICARDVSAVVLDEQEAVRLCERVREELDRQFIRHITLPETNVTLRLMDRVTLQELYLVIGNDYSCPNTLGCTQVKTNNGRRAFEISILSGQPREDVMTTCVHEYAHAWIIENVPPSRMKSIGKDAVEGFCELLSFLYAGQQGLAAGKANILANFYTRGQIHLFIAANSQFGFQEIVDWMKTGEDPLLLADNLSRVRRLEEPPQPAVTNLPLPGVDAAAATPPPLPKQLVLRGVIISEALPMAVINDQNFGLMDRAVVRLAATNHLIRCLEIRTNSVLIQFEATGDRQELFLP
jgi:hypothetical protein